MTPKYSTDSDDDSTQWDSDTHHVLAEWTSQPFIGVGHRRETVEHRVAIEYTHEVGVDVRHEVRSEDTEKFAGEWEAVETVEVREYGARYNRSPSARYLR